MSVKVLISTQNRVQSKKKGQNHNASKLGQVSIDTRNRPSNVLILVRVLGLDSAHPYWPNCKLKLMHPIVLSMQRKIALYVSFFT